jgi:hypothetical protein
MLKKIVIAVALASQTALAGSLDGRLADLESQFGQSKSPRTAFSIGVIYLSPDFRNVAKAKEFLFVAAAAGDRQALDLLKTLPATPTLYFNEDTTASSATKRNSYTVLKGQNIGRIAEQIAHLGGTYNERYNSLISLNKHKFPKGDHNLLVPGAVLILPSFVSEVGPTINSIRVDAADKAAKQRSSIVSSKGRLDQDTLSKLASVREAERKRVDNENLSTIVDSENGHKKAELSNKRHRLSEASKELSDLNAYYQSVVAENSKFEDSRNNLLKSIDELNIEIASVTLSTEQIQFRIAAITESLNSIKTRRSSVQSEILALEKAIFDRRESLSKLMRNKSEALAVADSLVFQHAHELSMLKTDTSASNVLADTLIDQLAVQLP